MHEALTHEQIEELRGYPTPTVSNAIELFGVRRRNEGFMRPGILCRFPELRPIVGYAVTAAFRAQEPAGPGGGVDDEAYYEYVTSQREPRICIAQDLDAEPVGALFGECMSSLHQALGCAGHITDGGVRDLEETRALGFQFFSGCVEVSHAYVHMTDFGEAVRVGGLEVEPGDLLHGDGHGVCKIPPQAVGRLAEACAAIEELERPLLELAQSDDFTPQRYVEVKREFERRYADVATDFAVDG